jgi:DDE_Tnp_1-associated
VKNEPSTVSSGGATVPALVTALAQVPDFRRKQGRRYRLESVLVLGVAATLCGYDSYSAMAQWGKNYGRELAVCLGFDNGKTPSVGTLFTVFSKVDKHALNAVLFAWNEQVLHALGFAREALPALSVDGKTLRGTRTQQVHAGGSPVVECHLLSAVSHGLGLCLAQEAVTSKENEIPAMKRLLEGLVLEGRVVTMDALLTQKDIAHQIVSKKGTS